MRDPNDTAPCMGVFGLRITLGRPFPGSLPVVSPTSSPSPLRNSPGFTPGSCDLIRAAPYRLMEDIRDPHSMPHSPVNIPGHTTESARTTSCGAKSYTVTARCLLPIASEPSSTVMQTLRESKPLDAKASGRVVTAQIVESTTPPCSLPKASQTARSGSNSRSFPHLASPVTSTRLCSSH